MKYYRYYTDCSEFPKYTINPATGREFTITQHHNYLYHSCFMCDKLSDEKDMVNIIDDIWFDKQCYGYVCSQVNTI